jgi:hypothetical protein
MSDLFRKQHKDCNSHVYRDSKKLGSARRHFRERERERKRRRRRITIFNAEADRERLLRIDFARRERTFAL